MMAMDIPLSAACAMALAEAGKNMIRSEDTDKNTFVRLVVLAFAGLRLRETQLLVRELAGDRRWSEVAMHARIVAVDDYSHFSRPGPRLVDGIELLAWVLHRPRLFLKPRTDRAAELIEAGWIDVAALPVLADQPVRS